MFETASGWFKGIFLCVSFNLCWKLLKKSLNVTYEHNFLQDEASKLGEEETDYVEFLEENLNKVRLALITLIVVS